MGRRTLPFSVTAGDSLFPLSASSMADLPISPSRYLAPAVPDVASAASATRVSPSPVWAVHSHSPRTIDVFPTYEMCPEISCYEPTTSPVTSALPVNSDYVSPVGPASMDNFLAGDRSLMDGDSDLPLLPLPLLPLPDHCILPPWPVDGSSPADADPPFVSVSADLSHLRYFQVHRRWAGQRLRTWNRRTDYSFTIHNF